MVTGASGGSCAKCLGEGLHHVSTVWNAFRFQEYVNETMTCLMLSTWQILWGPYCDLLEAHCIVASSSGVVLASGLMAHTVHAFFFIFKSSWIIAWSATWQRPVACCRSTVARDRLKRHTAPWMECRLLPVRLGCFLSLYSLHRWRLPPIWKWYCFATYHS